MVIGGRPYKENQKGRASETGPSTTPSQVSTLAPTVAVDEGVNPPTITVGINGKTAQANLPMGGGNAWERLDINDLPTDFSVNDLIIFVLNIRLNIPTTPTSWNTAPSEPPTTKPTGSYRNTILVTGNDALDLSLGVRTITVGNGNEVRCILISKVSFYSSGTTNLNNKSGNILHIEATCFNGGGATNSSFYVTYDDIPTRIEAMYRCKTD